MTWLESERVPCRQPCLYLLFDHSAGRVWLEVKAGEWSCALLLVVPFGGGSCAALGSQGRGRWQSGPLAGKVSQQQIYMLGVSSGACWDGCHARGGGVCRKPCVRARARCLLNTCVYFATKKAMDPCDALCITQVQAQIPDGGCA